MNRSISLLIAAVSAPGLAAAQDISGGVTLGYGQHTLEGGELSTTALDGRIGLAFANGLSLDVAASFLDLGVEDFDDALTGQYVGLDIGYRLGNGLTFGSYFEQLDLRIDGFPIDISLESMGLKAGYTTGNLRFGAFIGQGSSSPDITELAYEGADLINSGLTATYEPREDLVLGAALLRTTLEVGEESLDFDLLGLAAAFAVTDRFSLFGGLSRLTVTEIDIDTTTVGLGGAYDMSALVGIDAWLSLELAQSSDEVDTIRIALTIPLGAKGTPAPLNSVADSVFNSRHGALNAALNAAY